MKPKRYPHTASGRLPFKTRPECKEPDYEFEWKRVQRMRKQRHPLILGGQSKQKDY